MKKYTIKDKSGTKKTIYAKDLSHALTFVDSKAGGFDYPDNENEADITWNNGLYIGKKAGYNRYAVSKKSGSKYLIWGVYSPKELDKLHLTEDSIKDDLANDIYNALVEVSKNKNTHSSFGWNGIIEGMVENILINKGIIKKEDRFKVRKQIQQQMKESRVQKLFKDSIKDDVVSNYFYFDLDDLGMSLDNAVNIMKSCGLTIVKIDKRSKEAKVYYRGTSAAEQKAADKLDISLDDSIKDSIKDEANLPTTIQALVNDEEAAIKAYEVAIKNLEGKIDETQMQVLINIMKDERRHVENLYAILNGQVTEKNLEDSIHDTAPGVDKKKFDRLVNYFNVWGKPSEGELQDVIDYYRLNSATAYQLLIYWGYKDEFKKLHFYDSLSKAVK